MGEYIKRESLMKFADSVSKKEPDGVKKVLDMDGLRCLVQNIHAVDAVEVVRCKDCKHMSIEPCGRYCFVWGFFNGAGDEGFCNYGERKEGEANE